jgi:rubrerythrin
MYNEFAQQTKEDGDLDVTAVFENISRGKAERCARFERILEAMGIHSGVQTIAG